MGRARRIQLPGLTFHVVQRGHNRDASFRGTEDYLDYLALLRTGALRSETRIHAYVLMTNHVHLLVTSRIPDGVSRLFHYVSGRYSAHFNKRHGRSGALWERRFHASPVDSDRYCLACYRYIELNPVRAGIVRSPDAYRWSSYRANATEAATSLISAHPVLFSLGKTPLERALRYRELLRQPLPADTLRLIRQRLKDGLPIGDAGFRKDLEASLRRPLVKPKRGRPAKRNHDTQTVGWMDEDAD